MFDLDIKNNRGFTIIELMVATSVFLILISLSTGVFVQTLRTQRTLSAVTAANESASQVLEQIARETRTGYNFQTSTANTLVFTSTQANDQIVGYKLVGNSVGRCVSVCAADSDFKAITPTDVKMEKLKFLYYGVNPADNAPPRITILMTVGIKDTVNIETNLETTVSARNISK